MEQIVKIVQLTVRIVQDWRATVLLVFNHSQFRAMVLVDAVRVRITIALQKNASPWYVQLASTTMETTPVFRVAKIVQIALSLLVSALTVQVTLLLINRTLKAA